MTALIVVPNAHTKKQHMSIWNASVETCFTLYIIFQEIVPFRTGPNQELRTK